MMRGVFFYGPPAAGKSTVTATLVALDQRYAFYERLKVGGGRSDGYRIVRPRELDMLRKARLLLWENSRYGAVYAVERESLEKVLSNRIPIVHLGQVEALDAISDAMPQVRWSRVYLWCSRVVAAERLAARRMGDLAERLRVWDETPNLPDADLTFNTAVVSPTEVARAIQLFLDS